MSGFRRWLRRHGARRRASAGTCLHLCRECGEDFVYPVTWTESGTDAWWLLLRCGACGVWRDVVASNAAVAAFDRVLDEGNAEIWKKPTQANRSETFISGAQRVRSRTFLAHIRHATATDNTLENTHPFEQHGRVFAHNGIVGDLDEVRRRLGSYTELMHGETDSEHYFTMVTKAIDDADGDIGAGITAAAQELASDLALKVAAQVAGDPVVVEQGVVHVEEEDYVVRLHRAALRV